MLAGCANDGDTGTAIGGFWERRSTVSLASRTWGELRAGRDYVPSYINWVRYDPFSHVGVAGSNNFGTSSQTGPIRGAFGSRRARSAAGRRLRAVFAVRRAARRNRDARRDPARQRLPPRRAATPGSSRGFA